jgi:hypothetical protein
MKIRTTRRTPAIIASLALVIGSALAPLATDPARAQEQAVTAGPPLAPFASMRVAIVPVQLWRADSSAWSKSVEWASMRLAIDSAVAAELQARGLGRRWAYAADVARSAKRNPTYATDPYALGVGRWRTTAPKNGDQIPTVVADNLRPLTALGDTRYALIPVELRAEGGNAILRLVLADTRGRTVVWGADLITAGGAGMLEALARHVADLVLEP